ncbi:tubulin epsilon chain isoform X3 [Tachysurus fulvidraco]|uniref:tubulin epsilon chain isoform X3 n=1 Tax=Tachysurus fulvidraco TaxID=1234273 RepID=UPI001FEEF987|nr:tubulin epsilon chain isoform X3 [Tachysurus fulvidraco]
MDKHITVIMMGQCGNQVGCRFWDLALREHAHVNKRGVYDEALSSFFRNVDPRSDRGNGAPGSTIAALKARAVLIDMEEGVLSQVLCGPLQQLFSSTQLISNSYGSGNNWAVGHHTYGTLYREQIVDQIRRAAEHCDCLQCFFLIHSMGGGTGSGLGTCVLKLLEDEFPDVCRIVTAVYPSAEDDVITSPYNSVLAMRELTEFAHCVLPVENQSLMDIVSKIQLMTHSHKAGSVVKKDCTIISGKGGVFKSQKPFDAMNNIVANLLLSITRLDQMFSDAFSKEHQLMTSDPRRAVYLACALMLRGNVQVSDLRRNIQRLRPTLSFVPWNQEGWKTGVCSVPPVGHTHSLLALANNTCVRSSFSELRERFTRLYRKKAHLHHYMCVEGMEMSGFSEALHSLSDLIEQYDTLTSPSETLTHNAPRLCIAT